MGLNMNVYGVKHERLWGNVVKHERYMIKMVFMGKVRSSLVRLLLPMRKLRGSVFKMCVYGVKHERLWGAP